MIFDRNIQFFKLSSHRGLIDYTRFMSFQPNLLTTHRDHIKIQNYEPFWKVY
jgi:hypothetical protein